MKSLTAEKFNMLIFNVREEDNPITSRYIDIGAYFLDCSWQTLVSMFAYVVYSTTPPYELNVIQCKIR